MTLGKKLEYARQHVRSILRHDDEPVALRRAAAEALTKEIAAELAAAEGREARRVAEVTGAAPGGPVCGPG